MLGLRLFAYLEMSSNWTQGFLGLGKSHFCFKLVKWLLHPSKSPSPQPFLIIHVICLPLLPLFSISCCLHHSPASLTLAMSSPCLVLSSLDSSRCLRIFSLLFPIKILTPKGVDMSVVYIRSWWRSSLSHILHFFKYLLFSIPSLCGGLSVN